MELQTVEVRFCAEKLATYTDHRTQTANTLYRTPEGLYLVYTDELFEGGTSALDAGRYPGEGFDEAFLRWGSQELAEVASRQ